MKQIFTTFTLIILTSSCGGNTCEIDAENYRSRECAIKVESRDVNDRWFSIEGTNVYNGNRNKYSDLGSWYLLFKDSIAIGDTVIKRKNELVFHVHKRDTVLSFPFECEGKVIK